MSGKSTKKYSLIKQAINKTGTTELSAVCLALEDIAADTVFNKWQYKSRAPGLWMAYQYILNPAGICKVRDVSNLINWYENCGEAGDYHTA